MVCLSEARGGDLEVYIGTYTRGDSQGIYYSQLNTETGALTKATLAAEIENPSFLAISPDKKNLYAVIETGKFKGEAGGGLAAFSVGEGGALTALSSHNTGGGAPCHLSVDPDGTCVLVANYSGGNVASFPIGDSGDISAFRSLIQHEGSSINPKRQKGPHAHAINIYGKGKYAAAADLGTDSVFLYLVKEAALEQVAEIKVKPGSGPRHIAFHPSEKYAYVINEMSLETVAFELESPTKWNPIQYISTLPPDSETKGSTAEIQMHPGGKFVYGSNRGHDTIVVYQINEENGSLKWIENEPIQGQVPRNFNITPDGKYLLAAGQKSNTVSVFTIDQKTGELEFTGHKIDVPSPVAIEFR